MGAGVGRVVGLFVGKPGLVVGLTVGLVVGFDLGVPSGMINNCSFTRRDNYYKTLMYKQSV